MAPRPAAARRRPRAPPHDIYPRATDTALLDHLYGAKGELIQGIGTAVMASQRRAALAMDDFRQRSPARTWNGSPGGPAAAACQRGRPGRE